MKIAATSDCHGMLSPDMVPECDVLVLAGDICPNWYHHSHGRNLKDAQRQLVWLESEFLPMLAKVNADHIVIVSGNHDWVFFEPATVANARQILKDSTIIYLQDESWEHNGVKFYGSPHQPWFHSWAFNFPENDHWNGYRVAKETWNKIPDDANVVITHGPPYKILDQVLEGQNVGCPYLRDRLAQVAPKLSIFGHIHESYGQEVIYGTTYANVALVSRWMNPDHSVPTFEV